MTTLVSVADYITEARTLLEDKVSPYRYSDEVIVSHLNNAVNSAAALRPDLFMVALRTPPLTQYVASQPTTTVAMDMRYRTALLYYVVGQTQLIDEEDTQDTRAAALLAKFASQLMTLAG